MSVEMLISSHPTELLSMQAIHQHCWKALVFLLHSKPKENWLFEPVVTPAACDNVIVVVSHCKCTQFQIHHGSSPALPSLKLFVIASSSCACLASVLYEHRLKCVLEELIQLVQPC